MNSSGRLSDCKYAINGQYKIMFFNLVNASNILVVSNSLMNSVLFSAFFSKIISLSSKTNKIGLIIFL